MPIDMVQTFFFEELSTLLDINTLSEINGEVIKKNIKSLEMKK